jgi:hypothetical protein
MWTVAQVRIHLCPFYACRQTNFVRYLGFEGYGFSPLGPF